MIRKIFRVTDIDQSLIDGMLSLSKHGIDIELFDDVAVYQPMNASRNQDYYFPDRDRKIIVTLQTAEQTAAFDEWFKREQFRYSLKGKKFLTLVRFDETISYF